MALKQDTAATVAADQLVVVNLGFASTLANGATVRLPAHIVKFLKAEGVLTP